MSPATAVNLAVPRWAHVPGETAEADHETLALALALVPARFEGFVPARHPALRYGLGLNDAGYFWESHEILEAVWAAAPQGGRKRILLRACIQIANANLKLRMQKPRAAARLLGPAGEIVSLIKPHYESAQARVQRGVLTPEQSAQVLQELLARLSPMGWQVAGVIRSPLEGQKGNVEYLAWLKPAVAGTAPA